jgi:hypothetical protein
MKQKQSYNGEERVCAYLFCLFPSKNKLGNSNADIFFYQRRLINRLGILK